MRQQLLIRHCLRLAGFLTFVGFYGLWGCSRPPDIRSEQLAPPLSAPAVTSATENAPMKPNWGVVYAAEEGTGPGPSRGITPGTTASPERATDPAIVQSVRNALQSDPGFSPQAKAIQVTAEKGVITLKGNVATEREKTAVAVMAQQIAGNTYNVDNQLMVRTP